VILDIETITPRYQGDPDAFPGLPFHEPCAIFWMTVNTRGPEIWLEGDAVDCKAGAPERDIIDNLVRDMCGCDKLITHNGRSFDLPVLGIRAGRVGAWWGDMLEPAPRYGNERRSRFKHWKDDSKTPWHFDLLDQVGDYSARSIKLGDLAEAWGLPGKVGCGGASVGDMWAAGKVEEVVRYCAHDVFLTWACFLKRGAVTVDRRLGELLAPSIDWAREQPLLGAAIEEHWGEVCCD
jgi:DNA polymerase elongation subunit (family B)